MLFILTLVANVITLTLLSFLIVGWDSMYVLRKQKNKDGKQLSYQSMTTIIPQRINR